MPPDIDPSKRWIEESDATETYDTIDLVDEYSPEEGQKLRARAYPVGPLLSDVPFAPTSGGDLLTFERVAMNPVVKGALDFRMRGAFQDPYEIINPNAQTHPEWDGLFAKHLELLLRQMANYAEYGHQPFLDKCRNILWNGMRSGTQIGEFDWKLRDLEWQNIEIVTPDPSNFDIWITETGQWQGFQYYVDGRKYGGDQLGKYFIAPYPFLANGNYYGQSLVQPIVPYAELLNEVLEAQGIAQAAFSSNPIILKFTNQIKNIQKMVKDLTQTKKLAVIALEMERIVQDGEDTHVVETQTVDVLPSRADAEGIKSGQWLAEFLTREIKRGLGVPDDIGLTSATGGAYAKAKVEEQSVVMPVHAQDRDYVCNFLNVWWIPNVIKTNYGKLPRSYRLPRFRRSDDKLPGTPINLEEADALN